jgi:sugar O-acyltransferase (sialic acid O-acetyltransferase NeuD family)
MYKKIILIGGGSHSNSCIDVINYNEDYKVDYIVDLKKINSLHKTILESQLNINKLQGSNALISIGQLKNGDLRGNVFSKYKNYGCYFPPIISKNSYFSKSSNIDEGTIIMHRVVINGNVSIGKNCIINSGCVIEHDTIIEDNVHIAPAAVILGGCTIKKNSFVGSNSTVKQNSLVGENSIISANQYYKTK